MAFSEFSNYGELPVCSQPLQDTESHRLYAANKYQRRRTDALKRFRPLRRRAFNILRPPRVELRFRKPNFRARLILDGL